EPGGFRAVVPGGHRLGEVQLRVPCRGAPGGRLPAELLGALERKVRVDAGPGAHELVPQGHQAPELLLRARAQTHVVAEGLRLLRPAVQALRADAGDDRLGPLTVLDL